jgi:hypothetical protein
VIAKLRRLPLRDVWRHEAIDFTRWLEENIEVLNEIVEIELTAAEREGRAGVFSVDLVAEDKSGRPVVIENQLERSDHDHLGKIITYLTAIEAVAAIWIVADPRPEHVSAMTWLNESSSADFYLVKAEAVAIEESPPAPLLTLIVGPSEETREAGETKKELAERHHVRLRFWTGLLDRAKDRTRLHSAVSPGTENWISTGAGKSGLAFNYVVRQHDSNVELYIDRGKDSGDENERIFGLFEQRKDEVETRFGDALIWQRLPGKRACRIRYDVDVGGYKDEQDWEKIQAALIDAMVRLEDALRPIIAEV